MKIEWRNIVWFIICEGTIMLSIVQLLGVFTPDKGFNSMIHYAILQPQKLLFNNMLYFLSLIYINFKNELEPQVIIRCQNYKILFFRLQAKGMVLLCRYIKLYFIPVLACAIATGQFSMKYVFLSLLVIILLAIFWYGIYCLIYIFFESHFWGIVCLLCSQLAGLVVFVVVGSTLEMHISSILYQYSLYVPVVAVFLMLEWHSLKRKEWLK